jgi:heptosyltransferase-2
MLDYLIYLLYRAGLALIRLLPMRTLFALGQVLGLVAWLACGKYRRLALKNIAVPFGDQKSPAEIGTLARRHFQRLGANLLCGLKLATMPLERVRTHVQIDNAEAAHRELRKNRAVVFLLSHLGNWELQAQILPTVIGYERNSTIFQRLRNPFIDQHVRRLRGRSGVELFDRREGFRKAIALLRAGGRIGILSDQHAGDQGLWVPFFGKLASTSPLPALLAKRTGAAVLGTAIYTDGHARWRMVFTDPIDAPGDSVEALTTKANELIARQIRRAPEDWFWVHNRWKTPKPNFLLARYKRGVYLPSETPKENLKRFRLLIRASNWLGDSVLSIPAVRAIKLSRPDTDITVLTPANLAPLWNLVPEADKIISLTSKSLRATVRLLRQEPEFDVAIIFPNSLRTALEVWLSGIPRRVGYPGHYRRWLLNQIVREPRKSGPLRHQSERYLKIAHDCGAETSADQKTLSIRSLITNFEPPDTRQTFTTVSPAQTNHLSDRSTAKADQILLGLCAGAEYGPAKQWLPERFAEVAALVSAESGAHWILFGTRNELAIGEKIADSLGDRCTNRIGQTTLEQLIDELRTCQVLLTNDTGTMHLAALLGLPVVALFGSTEPRLTAPLGRGHIVLRRHVECSPCFLRQCPIDFRCMKAISAEEVCNAVISILQPAVSGIRS